MHPSEFNTQTPVERKAVRIVLIDARGSILLLHTRDLSDENFGSTWELPGGGVEDGESFFATAYREVKEETGIELEESRVSTPKWRRDVLYTYRGQRRLQHETIAVGIIEEVAPVVSTTLRVAFESEDHFEYRWWPQQHIADSKERFFPRSLPAVLPRLLAGEDISEPLEVWETT